MNVSFWLLVEGRAESTYMPAKWLFVCTAAQLHNCTAAHGQPAKLAVQAQQVEKGCILHQQQTARCMHTRSEEHNNALLY